MGIKKKIIKKVAENPSLKLKTSEILQDFLDNDLNDKGKISLDDVFEVLKHRGFGLLFIFFGIIGVLALPPLSMIAAIPLIFLSYQFFMNYQSPYFPKFIKQKKFEKSSFKKAVIKAISYSQKVEKFIKPRISFLFLPMAERITGLLMIVFCLSIVIPLPMTNFLPSVAIIFLGFGMMEKDGVMTIIGLIMGFLGWAVTILILLFGISVIEKIFA